MKKIGEENSKEKILAAATKLFAKKSFEEVSIREICREAGVNICMISYYWGGKKELYEGIIEDLIERQTAFAKSYTDLNQDLTVLTKNEQIELLYLFLDKIIDFLYMGVSSDLIVLLIREQQNPHREVNSPAFAFLKKLIALVFEKDENDREMIFKTLFIISQLNSPKILPVISLRRLGQDTFTQEDIKIIKDNVKFYVYSSLKEAGIV